MVDLAAYFQRLWQASREKKLTINQQLIYRGLIIASFFYRIFFFIIQKIKSFRAPYKSRYPVISIGNISVGGTGKSVFVRYLYEICVSPVAVLLRGYKRKNTDSDSLLVSDGSHLLISQKEAGDEAYMLALQYKGPVVVGSNRGKSAQLLEKLHNHVGCIVLDDAYQHKTLYKDLEIVLLDARFPFDNGYCLPAGGLREKDISRAQVIIITHADSLSVNQRDNVKRLCWLHGAKEIPILFGTHAFDGVFEHNEQRLSSIKIAMHKVFIFAGIGSWSGFVQTVQRADIPIVGFFNFADHHSYTENDILYLVAAAKKQQATMLLMTEKDWVKIAPLLSKVVNCDTVVWSVLRVKFAFLSSSDEVVMHDILSKKGISVIH